MERKRISLELSEGLLNKIDQFKREWGLRNRGAIVERLLQELLINGESEVEIDQDNCIQLSQGQVDEYLSDFGRNRITPRPSKLQPKIEGLDDSDFNESGAPQETEELIYLVLCRKNQPRSKGVFLQTMKAVFAIKSRSQRSQLNF